MNYFLSKKMSLAYIVFSAFCLVFILQIIKSFDITDILCKNLKRWFHLVVTLFIMHCRNRYQLRYRILTFTLILEFISSNLFNL